MIDITSLSHELRGIGHRDGKTIFVDGALLNEHVEIELTRKNKHFSEARVKPNTPIINPSSSRTTPACEHFDICGGCQLQHIEHSQQILLKQESLLNQLLNTAKIKPAIILEPLWEKPWNYRYKTRLSVKYVEKKQKLLIGFHEKSGRFIADLTHCKVLHPLLGDNIELLREFILSLSIYKHIPQLEAACDDNNTCALIIRHLENFSPEDYIKINNFKLLNTAFKIYLQPTAPKKIDNMQDLNYSFENITFHFQPTDFTQINPAINKKMLALAIELLEPNQTDNILDLFCGLGNFTLPLAKHCKTITGIEGEKKMVERAKQNAVLNNINNTEFYTCNLFEKTLDVTAPWAKKKYTKILIDPPRTGALEILDFIGQQKPILILYVSCNPATLARDANILINQYHYKLIKTGIIDMFPHTKHIESINLFGLNI